MIFCGQCGLQLAPGTIRCPRCGTAVEAETALGEYHGDDPTVASSSIITNNPLQPNTQHPAGPPTPNNQQKLILRPGSGNSYDTQAAYGATSRVDAQQNYATQAPNTGYPTQSGGNYPTQSAYPTYTPQSGGNYPTQQTSYPTFVPPGGVGYQQPYPQQPAGPSKGRTTGLVFILLGLLLILSAVVLFILQHNGAFSAGGTGSGSPPSAASQQAQAIIQQYYDDINKRDFRSAYALWKNNPQSLTAFRNGFRNTQQDTVTFGNITEQSDGTVKVTVTVNATEKAASGTKQSIYNGYYTVGQQSDGTWKILQGNLNLT